MPQYSMTGNILDSAAPGKYFDPLDLKRRQVAQPLSSLIESNPNFGNQRNPRNPGAAYLGQGLAYDYEGLLSAYAQKYGQDNAMKLLDALPHMSREDLLATQEDVRGAARESDAVSQRERQAYERAGMEYVSGAYRPKVNGQTP